MTYVAVVGPGEGASASALSAGAVVGRELATRGAVVVCGGLGGAMEACCRGAREAGGTTVGLLPGADRAAGNAFLSVAIPTGLGELRNGLVVRAADAVVAVPGGFGTLSEVAFALKTGRPVVVVGSWRLAPDEVVRVDDPAEAAARAVELARTRIG